MKIIVGQLLLEIVIFYFERIYSVSGILVKGPFHKGEEIFIIYHDGLWFSKKRNENYNFLRSFKTPRLERFDGLNIVSAQISIVPKTYSIHLSSICFVVFLFIFQ